MPFLSSKIFRALDNGAGASAKAKLALAGWMAISTGLVTILLVLDSLLEGRGVQIWGPKILSCKSGVSGCSKTWANEDFCERIMWDHFLRTKWNAVSNVAFCIAGFGVFAVIRARSQTTVLSNHIQRYLPLSYSYALLFIWVGIGSFLNHAACTRWSREFDRAGMWAAAMAQCSLGIVRFLPVSRAQGLNSPEKDPLLRFYRVYTAILWLLSICAALFHFCFGEEEIASPLLYFSFYVLIILTVLAYPLRFFLAGYAFCFRQKTLLPQMMSRHRWLALGVLLVVAAYVLWHPKRLNEGQCPNIDGPWWTMTHGFWHIFLAAGGFCVWWYQWTEYEVVSCPDRKEGMAVDDDVTHSEECHVPIGVATQVI